MEQTFLQLAEELKSMTRVGDLFVGAMILLPRGDMMSKDHVVGQSHDANGNALGRSHTNPIIDTVMYQVEFAGGNIT